MRREYETTYLFLDIETAPECSEAMRDELLRRAMRKAQHGDPPANYKNPEAIAKWRADKLAGVADDVQADIAAGGLHTHLGRIAAIGYAVNGGAPIVLCRGHESDILAEFAADVAAMGPHGIVVGHNVLGFDLPFLAARYMATGRGGAAARLPYRARPWDDSVFDTMLRWPSVGGRDMLALDVLHVALLGEPGKAVDVDPASAWALPPEELAAYCAADIEATRRVFCRMTGIQFAGGGVWQQQTEES